MLLGPRLDSGSSPPFLAIQAVTTAATMARRAFWAFAIGGSAGSRGVCDDPKHVEEMEKYPWRHHLEIHHIFTALIATATAAFYPQRHKAWRTFTA